MWFLGQQGQANQKWADETGLEKEIAHWAVQVLVARVALPEQTIESGRMWLCARASGVTTEVGSQREILNHRVQEFPKGKLRVQRQMLLYPPRNGHQQTAKVWGHCSWKFEIHIDATFSQARSEVHKRIRFANTPSFYFQRVNNSFG